LTIQCTYAIIILNGHLGAHEIIRLLEVSLKSIVLLLVAVSAAVSAGSVTAATKSSACVRLPDAPNSAGVYMMPNPHLLPRCGYWRYRMSPAMYKNVVTCPKGTQAVNIFVDHIGALIYACKGKDSSYAKQYRAATTDDVLLVGNTVTTYFDTPWYFPSSALAKYYISIGGKVRVRSVVPRNG
jgi:hypothetical protein